MVFPLRVMVKLFVDESMNVLFCAPFVPEVFTSAVTLVKNGSASAAETAVEVLDAANISVVLRDGYAVPVRAITEE